MNESLWLAEVATDKLLFLANRYEPKRTLAYVKTRLIPRRFESEFSHLTLPKITIDHFEKSIRSGRRLVELEDYITEVSYWRIELHTRTAIELAQFLWAYCSTTIHSYLFCESQKPEKELKECDLSREAFYPFPITIKPEWLSSTVVSLLRLIHNDCAFHLMPILADALEDADCDNKKILNHCRHTDRRHDFCWIINLFNHVV